MTAFPAHLSEFIVDQHYDRYTPINQAVWRYVMRQNFAYFREKGHPSYVYGLEASGISVERIPDVAHMNECLSRFGWSAVTIDGLVPSTVFMDFQARGILPVSADIRTLDHLAYTPAPDILHETAGHAPILVDQKFTTFVKRFGQLGAKIFSSKEDHEIYEATRLLAILKESPSATPEQVQEVEDHLKALEAAPREPSEYTLVSRLYWWTVEYGLIGELNDPKIYGAGLLSSVGESQLCYQPQIKKLPFSLEGCIGTAFDITTYQPQLFVCESFDQLIAAVEELESRMSFRIGGTEALQRAHRSGHTATAVYSSGLQVTGTFAPLELDPAGEAVFLKTEGPTVLAMENRELPGHGQDYHKAGYGAPIGKLKGEPTAIEDLTDEQLKAYNLEAGRFCHLTFESGVEVKGGVAYVRRHEGKVYLIGFESCTVAYQGRTLHKSYSDVYHMAVGARIVSAFAGAADMEAFYGQIYKPSETLTPVHAVPEGEARLHAYYQAVRDLRESRPEPEVAIAALSDTLAGLEQDYPKDWLLRLEVLEILADRGLAPDLQARVLRQLEKLQVDEDTKSLIQSGLALLDMGHLEPASQA